MKAHNVAAQSQICAQMKKTPIALSRAAFILGRIFMNSAIERREGPPSPGLRSYTMTGGVPAMPWAMRADIARIVSVGL